MKLLIPIITGLVIFLNSCVETDRETGYEKALEFYEKHTQEFFDSELSKFKYHPRTQYDLILNDSNLIYRVLVRENRELYVINPSGFINMFNLPVDTNYFHDKAFFRFENSEFIFEIENYECKNYSVSETVVEKTVRNNIKYVFPKETVENNPIEYFDKLEKLRNNFGIINYFRIFDSSVVWLYFSPYDYLIFIPDNFQFKEKYRDYWEKELKNGKKLDNNWYYFKSEEPLDVG